MEHYTIIYCLCSTTYAVKFLKLIAYTVNIYDTLSRHVFKLVSSQ